MKTIDRAELIQQVMAIRNAADLMLEVLLPEELPDGCPHPAEAIEDRGTMDESLFVCKKCGAESTTPFPSILQTEG